MLLLKYKVRSQKGSGPGSANPGNKVLACKVKGRLYDTRVRTAMLYDSETWTLNVTDLRGLERN